MSGIALLLPDSQMYQKSEEIIQEKEHHIIYRKETSIDTVVTEARKAIAEGANIVVARGHQAREIKRYTKVPVVEIVMTAQELGLAIVKAKEIIRKEYPIIGIFSWEGMLCDTTYFEELFQVKILRYYLDDQNAWENTINDAIQKKMDFLIGGEKCVKYANQKGIPALPFTTTGEALKVAIGNAETLYYMSQVEQHNYAQLFTVLDSSFNGIIKTDEMGNVLLINRVMEQILQIKSDKVLGMPVTDLLEGIDREIFGRVLLGTMDNYSTFINTAEQALVVIVEPIVVEENVTGTIVSCNCMKRMNWSGEDTMREQFLHGFVARGNLDDLVKRMPSLKKVADMAKLYAASSSPILIEGKSGQELEDLCQGIHNYSLRKNGPFLVINMASLTEEQQMKALFGDGEEIGAVMKANYGTIVIRAIDKLILPVQQNMLQVISKKHRSSSPIDNDSARKIDVRIIGCTSKNLTQLKNKGLFRKDLYYLLETFKLIIPNLSERKEDVAILLDEYIKKY
ncbi:MAG: sigma 54-interacting transcriptional regulator, partial [Hungatella sp.]